MYTGDTELPPPSEVVSDAETTTSTPEDSEAEARTTGDRSLLLATPEALAEGADAVGGTVMIHSCEHVYAASFYIKFFQLANIVEVV